MIAYDPVPLPYNTTHLCNRHPYNAAGEAGLHGRVIYNGRLPRYGAPNLSYDNGVLCVEFTNIGTAPGRPDADERQFSYSPDGSPTTAYASRLELGTSAPTLPLLASRGYIMSMSTPTTTTTPLCRSGGCFWRTGGMRRNQQHLRLHSHPGLCGSVAHNYNPDVNSDDGSCETCPTACRTATRRVSTAAAGALLV